jgi:rhodanese-related sulfurtransferase
MFSALKKLFSSEKTPSLAELLADGALVIDVRTPGEFAGGHVKGAVNIPLDRLASGLSRLRDKDKPLVTCCASGMRSASAAALLKRSGYTRVANGGSWQAVQAKIQSR